MVTRLQARRGSVLRGNRRMFALQKIMETDLKSEDRYRKGAVYHLFRNATW